MTSIAMKSQFSSLLFSYKKRVSSTATMLLDQATFAELVWVTTLLFYATVISTWVQLTYCTTSYRPSSRSHSYHRGVWVRLDIYDDAALEREVARCTVERYLGGRWKGTWHAEVLVPNISDAIHYRTLNDAITRLITWPFYSSARATSSLLHWEVGLLVGLLLSSPIVREAFCWKCERYIGQNWVPVVEMASHCERAMRQMNPSFRGSSKLHSRGSSRGSNDWDFRYFILAVLVGSLP